MLNLIKSVGYGFLFPQLFSLVFVGKLAFLSAVFRTLILWRLKFRELPQSIFVQARGWGGWLNQKSIYRFSNFKLDLPKSKV
ncbi:hypothetical protein BJL85_22075 [Vibrio parahaemolyticus]|nr:hypothetical protein DA442_10130 [Vibrio parahaemolyticus]EGQ8739751.1 hypothetical protein [Vibrio parahaemolyticus]EGQ8907588.1 hypothetical protein [Vibrio parahaemolyticus]EGR3101513.1 hypothetical protein [Vibrio parahaemolyticus]OAR66877.1 hypothetical protein EM70_020365 [Vibrio parahaemolyticus]